MICKLGCLPLSVPVLSHCTGIIGRRRHDQRRNDHCTDSFGQAFPVCQAAVYLLRFLSTLLSQHSAGVSPPAPPPPAPVCGLGTYVLRLLSILGAVLSMRKDCLYHFQNLEHGLDLMRGGRVSNISHHMKA
jgi:hypothetical protein